MIHKEGYTEVGLICFTYLLKSARKLFIQRNVSLGQIYVTNFMIQLLFWI